MQVPTHATMLEDFSIMQYSNSHTAFQSKTHRQRGRQKNQTNKKQKTPLGTNSQFQSLIVDILFLLKHHPNLQADGMVLDFKTSSARKQEVSLEIKI